MIKHRIDVSIKIIDSYLDSSIIKNVDSFIYNGYKIKPDKKIDNYYVFCNLLDNPKYQKVTDGIEGGVLIWEHPFYQRAEIKFKRGDDLYYRARPSISYPYDENTTGIKGRVNGEKNISTIFKINRYRYLLKGPIIADKYVDIASSNDSNIIGRSFIFSEGDLSQTVILYQNEIGYYTEPLLKNQFTEACEIYEVIDTTSDVNGDFILLLPSVKENEDENLEIEIKIDKNSTFVFKLKKDIITDVGKIDV